MFDHVPGIQIWRTESTASMSHGGLGTIAFVHTAYISVIRRVVDFLIDKAEFVGFFIRGRACLLPMGLG